MREIKYASIGKAVLIRMVGLQENYKDDQKLDRKKSGCFSCPHFGDSLKDHNCAACTACQKKVFFSPYINEQNRFGYQAPQSLCAMKLFLYLHFCSVTKSGAIEDISISSLAKRLNISQRNIHYCLKKLGCNGGLWQGGGRRTSTRKPSPTRLYCAPSVKKKLPLRHCAREGVSLG